MSHCSLQVVARKKYSDKQFFRFNPFVEDKFSDYNCTKLNIVEKIPSMEKWQWIFSKSSENLITENLGMKVFCYKCQLEQGGTFPDSYLINFCRFHEI